MKLKVRPYHPEEDSVQTTSMDLHPDGTPVLGPLIEASGVKTTHPAVPKTKPQPAHPGLTILAVIEHDELLPAQLCHQPEHDVIETDRWSRSQCVGLTIRARVQVAGSSW